MSDYVTIEATVAAVWRSSEEAADLLVSNPPEFGTNRSLVLAVVSHYGHYLKYASVELRDDEEIVVMACKKFAHALEYASERLRNSKQVVLIAVRQVGWALHFASARLRNEKEVVLVACNQDGMALMHASADMMNCIDVVCAALNDAVRSSLWRCRCILGFASADIQAKIAAFTAMAKDKNGILRSVNKNDLLALSAHLEEKIALRGIFLQLLHSGISIPSNVVEKRSNDVWGRTILPSHMQHIAGYAGVPVGAELRRLRLVHEILPIVTAYATKLRVSWSAVSLTKWR